MCPNSTVELVSTAAVKLSTTARCCCSVSARTRQLWHSHAALLLFGMQARQKQLHVLFIAEKARYTVVTLIYQPLHIVVSTEKPSSCTL